MEELKVGMKVYGILKFQGGRFHRWIPGGYKGVITQITDKGFWVKYDILRIPLLYNFASWNKTVFPDAETCEYEADKANDPGFKESFGKKSGSS